MSTLTTRSLPPYGAGMAAPGTVTSCGRMKLLPRSLSCCSARTPLLRLASTTGTLAALYWMMSGGKMPGGSWRTIWFAWAFTWAMAPAIGTLGWK